MFGAGGIVFYDVDGYGLDVRTSRPFGHTIHQTYGYR